MLPRLIMQLKKMQEIWQQNKKKKSPTRFYNKGTQGSR
jgi:hypothetical protein